MIAAATSAGVFTGHSLETIARREFTSAAIIVPSPVPGLQLIVAPARGEVPRDRKRPWAVIATVYAALPYGTRGGSQASARARVTTLAQKAVLAEIRHLAVNGYQFTGTLVPPNSTERETPA